jgi:hypothetical protein
MAIGSLVVRLFIWSKVQRASDKCHSCRLKIGITTPLVRFQVCAFRPFVPGIYKYQPFVRVAETVARILDRVVKPLLIFQWGIVLKDNTMIAPCGRCCPMKGKRRGKAYRAAY